jgi:hypothetical protein
MNAPPSPPLPWPSEATLWQRVLCFLKVTPLVALAIFTALSLVIKENYPFSNYPMYSNPSPERNYFMITDGEGKPIPVATLTGITCPKIGKIFRKRSDEMADKLKLKRTALPQEMVQAVGMSIFQQLRKEAAGMNKELPPKLQLMRTDITFEDGKIVELPHLIATE